MIELIDNIFTVNHWELMIVAAISAVAGYILKEALGSGLTASIFFPFFLVSGLISRYIFIENGVFLSANNDANLVIATGLGLSISLVVMTFVVRAFSAVNGIHKQASVDAKMGDRSGV